MGKIILLLTTILIFSAFSLQAQTKSLTVAVYNHGQALVNEIREMDLPAGKGRVKFSNVPESIKPSTLQVRSKSNPQALSVLDMNYEYDLIDTKTLLDRYVGKELKVILPDLDEPKKKKLQEAKLLANNDRPIFQVNEQIYMGNYDSIYLAKMPQGLRPRPTLIWLVENTGPAKQDIEVSYLTRRMKWNADYVLDLSKDNQNADLLAWITMENNSGKSFQDTKLRLVAGDVNVVREKPSRRGQILLAQENAMASKSVQEEEFFAYHLYSVDRPVDLKDKQSKQIKLMQASDIKVEKEFISSFSSSPDNAYRQSKLQKVNVFLNFKNSKDQGLGIPLPQGIVRAYQKSTDGSNLFIGEDRIDHTSKDAKVELLIGQAFDLEVKRKLVYLHRSENSLEYKWEIKIRNSSEETKEVIFQERMFHNWHIIQASCDYEKMDARHIRFKVEVPPSSQKDHLLISYQAVANKR